MKGALLGADHITKDMTMRGTAQKIVGKQSSLDGLCLRE